VVTASADGTARVWNSVGRSVGEPMTHTDVVSSARFSQDGRRVITAAGSAAWIWDVQTGHAMNLTLLAGAHAAVDFSPDGRQIVVAGVGSTIVRSPRGIVEKGFPVATVFSAITGQVVGHPMKHQALARFAARFSSDGKLVFTVEYGAAHVWNALTGLSQFDLAQNPEPTLNQFRPDGRQLVARSSDGTAQIWDLVSHRPIGKFFRQAGGISWERFSGDGRRILTATADMTARIWDAETHRPIGKPVAKVTREAILGRWWSRDGRWVVTAPADNALQLWDVDKSMPLGELMHDPATASRAIFSPEDRRLLTTSGRAGVWDVKSGQSIGEPRQQTPADFSPDGARVASIQDDGSVQLWSASTGEHVTDALARETGIARSGTEVQFSPDGERLAIGNWDEAQIWDVPVGRASDADLLASLAEAVGGYALTELGALLELTDREARFVELRRIAARVQDGDSPMSSFLRWFLAERSTRPISPLSQLPTGEYVKGCLALSSRTARDEACKAFPDHPLLAKGPR
jgi:WD40 repeat protein